MFAFPPSIKQNILLIDNPTFTPIVSQYLTLQLNRVLEFFSRCLFVKVYSTATDSTSGHREAEHHLPEVRLPARIRRMVLPQSGNLFCRQSRRCHTLQLRVSVTKITQNGCHFAN